MRISPSRAGASRYVPRTRAVKKPVARKTAPTRAAVKASLTKKTPKAPPRPAPKPVPKKVTKPIPKLAPARKPVTSKKTTNTASSQKKAVQANPLKKLGSQVSKAVNTVKKAVTKVADKVMGKATSTKNNTKPHVATVSNKVQATVIRRGEHGREEPKVQNSPKKTSNFGSRGVIINKRAAELQAVSQTKKQETPKPQASNSGNKGIKTVVPTPTTSNTFKNSKNPGFADNRRMDSRGTVPNKNAEEAKGRSENNGRGPLAAERHCEDVTYNMDDHTFLQTVGMLPVIGPIADVADTLLYVAEGDYKNAAKSAVSIIPGIGDAFGGVRKGVKGLEAMGVIADGSKVANNIADGKKLFSVEEKIISGAVKNADEAVKVTTKNIAKESVEEVTEKTAGKILGKGSSKVDKFFISDWAEYPDAPKPEGPFRILEGDEYDAARKLANSTNNQIHSTRPDLRGTQIHEMHPVKFGGSPTDMDNKIALTPKEHAKYTSFWNKVLREMKKGI